MALPAKVISTMGTNGTWTPPDRSSQRWSRAKTIIDASSAATATKSHATLMSDSMLPALEMSDRCS